MRRIQNMLNSIADMLNVFNSNKDYNYIIHSNGFLEDRKNLSNDFKAVSMDMHNTINKNNAYASIKNGIKK